MKYKFSIIETYTCTLDLPDGVTPEEFLRRGNDIPYDFWEPNRKSGKIMVNSKIREWSLPDDTEERVFACEEGK
jgi:hypothetical protein